MTREDLSMTGKRWRMSTAAPERTLRAQEALALLREQRAITPGAALTLNHPNVFPDCKRAVERIERAIDIGENIALFGDYDCDGITAIAQLIRMFRRRGVEPHVRLPHRVNDGYGFHAGIVEEFTHKQIKLVITADTGITATKEVAALQAQGIDVIITDHHHPQAEIPPAYAILHPLLSGRYALPHPSGAGVALQLIRAIEGGDWEGMATDWALASLGTVADLVELRGDNRTIVHHGLRALNTAPLEGGLRTLVDHIQHEAPLTSTDIAFRIAPRINAAGRMEDPMIALKALLEGGESLLKIEQLNVERQKQTAVLVEEAVDRFSEGTPPSFLFLADERYPHGLLGLIAGRLTEYYGKPSLVAAIDGTTCTASLRSPAIYNVTAALERSAKHLERFGGHAQAAGCTFALSEREALHTSLQADVAEYADPMQLVPTVPVDAIVDPETVTVDFCEELLSLEPFGQGNMEPRFLFPALFATNTRAVGGGAHLQLFAGGMKAIGFGLGHLEGALDERIDVVARVGIDTWQGRNKPQLFIEDIRITKTAPVLSE